MAEVRSGEVIGIKSADFFFKELSERVESLESFDSNNPLSKDIAIARVKKYIAKPENVILLSDLIEIERNIALSKIEKYANYNFPLTDETFKKYFDLHRNAVDVILPLMVEAVRWSKEYHDIIILDTIKAFVEFDWTKNSRYNKESIKLHYLSAFFLFYSCGIACLRYEKYTLLNKMFNIRFSSSIDLHSSNKHILCELNSSLFEKKRLNHVIKQDWMTPLSTFLEETLIKDFHLNVGDNEEFKNYFDILEYLISLNYLYLGGKYSFNDDWVPHGAYKWRRRGYRSEEDLFSYFFNQANFKKDDWDLLKGGMFNARFDDYTQNKNKVEEYLSKIHLY